MLVLGQGCGRVRFVSALVLFVAAFVGVSAAADAATRVSGANYAPLPLEISPDVDPLEVGFFLPENVAFIQEMPVNKRVTKVTIGDLRTSPSCAENATVLLRLWEHNPAIWPAAGRTEKPLSSSRVTLSSEHGRATFTIQPTLLERGKAYAFMLEATGSCRAIRVRSWAHNGGSVRTGAATCATPAVVQPSGSGSATPKRMWHEHGMNDRDSACAGVPPTGEFDPDMPSGWLVTINTNTRKVLVATTTTAAEPPCVLPFSFDGTQAGMKAKLWKESDTTSGHRWHWVCQYTHYEPMGSRAVNGWYHGAPWLSARNGAPRDVYLKLSGDDPFGWGADLLGPEHVSVGDPVNAVTGNVYELADDLTVPGRGLPLQFARAYNSQAVASPAAALGPGWSHSFEASVAELAGGEVELAEPTGARFVFSEQLDGSLAAPAGVNDRLSREAGGGYTLRRANGVVWEFSAAGRLEAIRDLNGNAITLEYDSGRIARVRDTLGRALTLGYHAGSGRLQSITDWTGRTAAYAYDDAGRLIAVTGRDGRVTSYAYDDGDRLTRVIEPGSGALPGRERTYGYDAEGRASFTEADGGTGRVEFTYEPGSSRTLVRDSEGNQSAFYYDAEGHVTRITDPDGHDAHWEWDAAGNNTAVIDQSGNRTDMTYDTAGNVTDLERPDTGTGRPTTSFEYGSHGRVTKVTDARGGETVLGYDGNWNLTSAIDPLLRETTREFNSHGQQTLLTLPGGAETTTTYDADGNVQTITDPREKTTTFDHDALGRLTSLTNARGHATQFQYDTADRLTKRIDPPALTGDPAGETAYDYDARGDLRSVTDPEGHATLYEHDRHHRQTAVEDATGRRSTSTYDTEGNLTSTTSPWGATTTYEYDKQRRLTKIVAPDGTAEGAITRLAYTPTGLTASVTDPNDHTTEFEYDAARRLVEVTDPLDNSARYQYSQTDELTASTDPAGVTTRYEYDLAGQLTEKSLDRPDPAADPTWSWTHTPAGDPESMTDPDGRSTGYTHDTAGNLTAIDYPGTSDDAQFGYNATGQLDEATNPLGTMTMTYDALGRIVNEQTPGGHGIARDYDRAGNLTELELPGNDDRAFAYDAADRVLSITAANGIVEYDYDTGGRLDLVRFPRPGERTDYDHDPLGRITKVANWRGTGQLIDELDYVYDKAGNAISINSAADSATFAYDELNRLTAETHTTGTPLSQSYTYDAAGNRLTATRDGQTTNYGYDDLGRLTSAGPATYTYNATGEQQTATNNGQTTNYSWRANGQLAAVDLPGTATDVSYGYDALDRRTEITRAATTTERLFADDEIVQTIDGSATRSFIRDPANRLLATSAAGDHRNYHLDAQGSIRAIVDANGTVTDTLAYSAFGEQRSATTSTPQPFGYLAQDHDPSTGLHDFRARAYDAALGRFSSRDPIAGLPAIPASLNAYQYGYNNPLRYTDTNGLFVKGAWDDVTEFVGGAANDAAGQIDLVCGSCDYAGHYLLSEDESMQFDWTSFAALGVLDLPWLKPIKLGKKAIEAGTGLYRAARGGNQAARAGDDLAKRTVAPLTREQRAGLRAALRDPNKFHHVFDDPRHNLGPLVQELGGREAVLREAILAVPRGHKGLFEVTTRLGRQDLTVRGRVVDGVPRIGTIFVS